MFNEPLLWYLNHSLQHLAPKTLYFLGSLEKHNKYKELHCSQKDNNISV